MEGTNEEQIWEYHGSVFGNIIGNNTPHPQPQNKEKKMSLFYSYQLTSLDAQKYFPNYVHHPFLHRLNASLSICFPIYISFPYQTQNLLGGKKNLNKNKNSLCCSCPSSCCCCFTTPKLEIFSYFFIKKLIIPKLDLTTTI